MTDPALALRERWRQGPLSKLVPVAGAIFKGGRGSAPRFTGLPKTAEGRYDLRGLCVSVDNPAKKTSRLQFGLTTITWVRAPADISRKTLKRVDLSYAC